MDHYDLEKTNEIDYKDYLDIMTKKYSEWDPIEEIKYAYKLFVADDPSGKITVRALKKIARELNDNISEEDLEMMVQEFDQDKDGMSKIKSRRRRFHQNHDRRHILITFLSINPLDDVAEWSKALD